LPADVEPGIHAGHILFENGGFTHQVPYSYMAGYTLGGDVGEEMVLVDGWGDEHEPYDNGVLHPCVSATGYPDYGQRNILLNIPDEYPTKNRTVLVAKIEWDNPGTIVDLYIKPTADSFFSQFVGTDEARFAPNEPTKNTIIWDAGYDINGTYDLHYECYNWAGDDYFENITITLQWFNVSLPTPTCDLTYWSRWDTNPVPFDTNDSLVGDHVEIKAEMSELSVDNLPEYNITRLEMEFLSGLYVVLTGTVAVPFGDVWPPPINEVDTYVWETVDGITANSLVRVNLHLIPDSGDPSVAVFEWFDLDENGEVDYATELGTQFLSVDDGGDHFDEYGEFVAPNDMSIAIMVYCWEWAYTAGMTYELTVDSRRSDAFLVADDNYTFDTYDFLFNITKAINVRAYTDTNLWFITSTENNFLGNFFAPRVNVTSPNGGEDWSTGLHNITWTAYDNNSDDIMTYNVLFSRDAGESWQLLAGGLTGNYFEWNTAPFLEGDDWLIEVRGIDNDTVYTGMQNPLDPWIVIEVPGGDQTYANLIGFDFGAFVQNDWPGYVGFDRSDAVFTAGSQTPPVTTTPPETTTTTTTPEETTPPPPIDPLLIGLVGGIGAGVVVVLILFLVKRK
jgi:hypothetical protein